MSWFPRGVWRYALLILVLLVLAAVASLTTIELIESSVRAHRVEDYVRAVTVAMLALVMGFLFLAGALGVWAIRSSAQMESRRRIGRFVDAMDYLSDGLLAMDRKGRVTGLNPAARHLSVLRAELSADPDVHPKTGLREYFPCLTAADVDKLIFNALPQEVECVSREPHGLRALRFRSQPSEDMTLILVSDVTGVKAQEMRGRQVARLQLIGRIARGVAHDFNNILCTISGYSAVLDRQKTLGGAEAEALRSIIREAQRGAALAGQMLDLSRTGVRGKPCERLAEHVEKAAALLRVGLSADWQVITDIQGEFDPVSLTDIQVEQGILNLGLLAADELAVPGFVHIRVRPPAREYLLDVGEDFAAVVLVAAYGSEPELSTGHPMHPESVSTASEAGVVQSVVRSMVEEVGGRLDVMVSPGNRHSYRLCVPEYVVTEESMSALGGVPEELRDYIANWRVLVAGDAPERRAGIEQHLKQAGMSVEIAGDIVSALQQVEAGRELTAMVFDKKLLGDEADALLRAILKLRPHAGVVVLSEAPDQESQALKADIVFEPASVSSDAILQALIRAKEMSGSRRRHG